MKDQMNFLNEVLEKIELLRPGKFSVIHGEYLDLYDNELEHEIKSVPYDVHYIAYLREFIEGLIYGLES